MNALLIIRRELASYVRTPSGWIIAACILLLDGIIFNSIAVGSVPRKSEEVLRIFLLNAGAFTMVAAVVFSIRLLAEERTYGTHVLLFTSPIREGEIILGKFFASLIFLCILTLLTLYLPALIFVNGKVSIGHIVAGYMGMLLLGASTLAVCVLASTLVKNQFLAVIVSAVFVGFLELMWYVGNMTDPPFQTLVAYMSPFWNHFQPFTRGVVHLSDVVFYLSMIFFSLLAATRVLQSQRWQ